MLFRSRWLGLGFWFFLALSAWLPGCVQESRSNHRSGSALGPSSAGAGSSSPSNWNGQSDFAPKGWTIEDVP